MSGEPIAQSAEAQRLAPLRDLQRHLRQLESDCDKAQGGLRQSAATWIVSGFGAMGILLSLAKDNVLFSVFDKFAAIAVVALAADLGLRNLWILDQLVYQQLLHTAFSLGLWIEQKLPKDERYRIALYALVQNAGERMSAYYRVPVQVFLTIAAFSVGVYGVKLTGTICFNCPVDWFSLLVLFALLVFFGLSFVRYIDVVDEVRHDDIEDKLQEIREEMDKIDPINSGSAAYETAYKKLANGAGRPPYVPWSKRIWDAAEMATKNVPFVTLPYFVIRIVGCSVAWFLMEFLTAMGLARRNKKEAS